MPNVFTTTIKRFHEEELNKAIEELEQRGFKRASEVIPVGYERKDYHYHDNRINARSYVGTISNNKGYMIKMSKEN